MSDDCSYTEKPETTPEIQNFRKKTYSSEKTGFELLGVVWRSEFVSVLVPLIHVQKHLTVNLVNRALPLLGPAFPRAWRQKTIPFWPGAHQAIWGKKSRQGV